jgi:hypothetical protein
MIGKLHIDRCEQPAFTRKICADVNDGYVAKWPAPAHVSGGKTVSTLLALLDARLLPGVTEGEFRRLFAKCDCGLVTTQRAFRQHKCLHEVIDLTGED